MERWSSFIAPSHRITSFRTRASVLTPPPNPGVLINQNGPIDSSRQGYILIPMFANSVFSRDVYRCRERTPTRGQLARPCAPFSEPEMIDESSLSGAAHAHHGNHDIILPGTCVSEYLFRAISYSDTHCGPASSVTDLSVGGRRGMFSKDT